MNKDRKGNLSKDDAEALLVKLNERVSLLRKSRQRLRLFSLGLVVVAVAGASAGTLLLTTAHRSPTNENTVASNTEPRFSAAQGALRVHPETNSGPKYSDPSQASSANGVPVPSCSGAVSYNSPEPGIVWVHFGESDALLGVLGGQPQKLDHSNGPSPGSEHFKTQDASIAGYPGVGGEWDGQYTTIKNLDGSVERIGSLYRSWIIWNVNQTGNVLYSATLSLTDLTGIANSCSY